MRFIALPLLRQRPLELRRVVDPEGQDARTEFHLLGEGDSRSPGRGAVTWTRSPVMGWGKAAVPQWRACRPSSGSSGPS